MMEEGGQKNIAVVVVIIIVIVVVIFLMRGGDSQNEEIDINIDSVGAEIYSQIEEGQEAIDEAIPETNPFGGGEETNPFSDFKNPFE